MNTPTLEWISDPGHAWLAVSLEAYPDALNYSTGYGYMDNARVYLEEDWEAVAFLTAHPELDGRSILERVYDFDAPCRRLNRAPAMLEVTA